MSTDEVARRVAAFHRRGVAIAALEAFAVGVAAALLALAAGLAEGADLEDRALALVALAAGGLGGAACFGERRPSPRASVRRFDRRLAAGGVVETAWELPAERSRVADLLVQQALTLTARRLPVRAPSPAFLAGPLVALALVLIADPRPASGSAASISRLAPGAGVPRRSAGAQAEDASASAARERVAQARAERARAVLRRLASAADPDERARARAEWTSLEAGRDVEETAATERAGPPGASASLAGSERAERHESSGSGADDWSGRGSAGMMSGRSAPAEAGAAVPPPGVQALEPSAPPARSRPFGWIGSEPWPAEYEELIERWLEQRAR